MKQIFLISFLILFGYSQKDSYFEKYCSKIPLVHLPLKIVCGNLSYNNDSSISSQDLKRFVPKDLLLCGKINFGNGKSYIIYCLTGGDITHPYLYTYGSKGDRLDSLSLHIDYCGGDELIELNNWSIINTDKTILEVDTTRNYVIDTVHDRRVLTTVVVTKKLLGLNKEGLFREISYTRDSIK